MKARAKPKHESNQGERKPATSRRTAIARLVPSTEPNIDDEAEDRQRGGVQSLGRAFAILEEVARHREGIGLAELSKLVGLHNSTTFHLAKTMVSLGYIRQERDSKRYRVGRPLFALAASALDEIEMVNVATPMLEELSRETGESGHFAVRMGDAVVVIARTSGPGAFQLTDRVGVVRPAHCTALGKIILAVAAPRPAQALPRARRAEAIDREIDHRGFGAAARDRRDPAQRRSPSTTASSMRRCAASPCPSMDFTGRRGRRARHLRPDLAHVRPGACRAAPRSVQGGRRSPVRRIRRRELSRNPL